MSDACLNLAFRGATSLKWLLSLSEFKFLREGNKKFSLSVSSVSQSGSSLSSPSPLLPAVFLNIGICVSAAGSVDQLGPPRWWSQQSCVLHVNKTSAQLWGPRLSERKSHQTTLEPEKNLSSSCKWVLVWILSAVMQFLCTNTDCNNSECSLHQGGAAELNHYLLTKWEQVVVTQIIVLRQRSEKLRTCLPSRPVYGTGTAQKRANRCRTTHRLLLP